MAHRGDIREGIFLRGRGAKTNPMIAMRKELETLAASSSMGKLAEIVPVVRARFGHDETQRLVSDHSS
ncbi:MAG TPA: hypothetical protein VHN14_29515 [Kofleriaceae bacterium]|nr:hypothetical protein [Kofleriaceae bacterium]